MCAQGLVSHSKSTGTLEKKKIILKSSMQNLQYQFECPHLQNADSHPHHPYPPQSLQDSERFSVKCYYTILLNNQGETKIHGIVQYCQKY